MKKVLLIMLSFLLVLTSLSLTACGGLSIDLNDYLVYVISGYDGYGKLTSYFDYGKFETELYDTYSNNTKNIEKTIIGIENEIGGRWDKEDGLSNGDTITYSWDIDADFVKKAFGLNLIYEDVTVDVEGLDDIETFDIFEGLEIEVSGTAPNGTLYLYSETYPDPGFKASKSSGLSNGDEIIISINDLPESEYIMRYGKIPERNTMKYTVSGLAHYAENLAEIPQDMLDKMDKQLEDEFYAHAASSWNSGVTAIKEFKNIGNYFLKLKEGASGSQENYVYCIYKVVFSDPEKFDEDFEYYWYGFFENVMILADGTCTVDLSNYTASKSSSVFGITSGDYLSMPVAKDGSRYYVAGFKDLDSLFNKYVVSKIDKYEYEVAIEE